MQYSFGLFFAALTEHFGWSRASLSAVFSVCAATYSLLGVVAGRLTDRWGARPIVAGGAVALGGGLLLAAAVHSIGALYAAYLLAAVGMSTAYVPCTAAVARAFPVRRGLISGLALSGASVGMFVCPPVVGWLIDAVEWRHAYAIVGSTLGLSVVALSLALGSGRDPTRATWTLDRIGDVVSNRAGAWQTRDAPGRRAFMALVGVYVAAWLPGFVPLVHLVAFAEDIGLSRGVGAAALSVLGAGSLVGRIALGALSDRIGRRPVLASALVLQAVGFIMLMMTTGPTLLMTAAAVFGLGSGAVVGLLPAVVADLFGSAHAASLIGAIVAAAAVPIALGPWFAGWMFDMRGTYANVFLASAVVNLVGLGLLLPVRSPRISN